MTKLSPTQRSLAHLRKEGWTLVAVVEHWNPHAHIRQDLFGFIDILAIRNGETLAVQACARSSISDRVRKIAEHPNTPAVREAGWAIHVHGWGRLASSRKVELRTVDVS